MKKQDLIPIGVLSKITNVHIQSLRYYEKIGVLKPAYIDEKSRYRYYAFSQIRIVEAIQYCVELDIPLKDFSTFISDEDNIDYATLIAYGHKIANEKIESIMHKMKHLDSIEKEMLHSNLLCDNSIISCELPEKTYYTIPYSGTQNSPYFRNSVIQLLNEVHSHNYTTGYDIGLLTVHSNEKTNHYLYTDILNLSNGITEQPNIIHIPKSIFHCLTRTCSDISSAPELFHEYIKDAERYIIIEADYFTEKYSYSDSVYELRCTTMLSE